MLPQPDIDLQWLDRAEVLVALFNAATALPKGDGRPALTIKEATQRLEEMWRSDGRNMFVDTLDGVIIKCHFGRDYLNTRFYNEAHGPGKAEAALAPLIAAALTRLSKSKQPEPTPLTEHRTMTTIQQKLSEIEELMDMLEKLECATEEALDPVLKPQDPFNLSDSKTALPEKSESSRLYERLSMLQFKVHHSLCRREQLLSRINL